MFLNLTFCKASYHRCRKSSNIRSTQCHFCSHRTLSTRLSTCVFAHFSCLRLSSSGACFRLFPFPGRLWSSSFAPRALLTLWLILVPLYGIPNRAAHAAILVFATMVVRQNVPRRDTMWCSALWIFALRYVGPKKFHLPAMLRGFTFSRIFLCTSVTLRCMSEQQKTLLLLAQNLLPLLCCHSLRSSLSVIVTTATTAFLLLVADAPVLVLGCAFDGADKNGLISFIFTTCDGLVVVLVRCCCWNYCYSPVVSIILPFSALYIVSIWQGLPYHLLHVLVPARAAIAVGASCR